VAATKTNFVEKTRNDYIRHVRTFTAFLGRSPDTATAEDLRRFQLHQTQTGVRPEAVLAYLSRYTHRVAIANSRLIAFDEDHNEPACPCCGGRRLAASDAGHEQVAVWVAHPAIPQTLP
jgi:hypothetical protein